MTADGHNPTDSAGQSVVSWEASDAAIQNNYTLARYELRYGKVPEPSATDRTTSITTLVDLLPDKWLPVDENDDPEPLILNASRTKYILEGLSLGSLYRVELMAVYTRLSPASTKESEWRHAYTYPTHDSIVTTAGLSVGVIPITGCRPADPGISYSEIGEYRYVLCTDKRYLPTGISDGNRAILIGEVVAGSGTWGDAYDDIGIFYIGSRDCTDQEVDELADEVDDDETDGVAHHNVIIFAATGTEMRTRCKVPDVAGCATNHPPYAGPIRSTRITLNKDIGYKQNLDDADCTRAFSLSIHEVGHAFGLGDTNAGSASSRYGLWPTVMSDSYEANCEPTALDIAAIRAIYQSR